MKRGSHSPNPVEFINVPPLLPYAEARLNDPLNIPTEKKTVGLNTLSFEAKELRF